MLINNDSGENLTTIIIQEIIQKINYTVILIPVFIYL